MKTYRVFINGKKLCFAGGKNLTRIIAQLVEDDQEGIQFNLTSEHERSIESAERKVWSNNDRFTRGDELLIELSNLEETSEYLKSHSYQPAPKGKNINELLQQFKSLYKQIKSLIKKIDQLEKEGADVNWPRDRSKIIRYGLNISINGHHEFKVDGNRISNLQVVVSAYLFESNKITLCVSGDKIAKDSRQTQPEWYDKDLYVGDSVLIKII